MSEKTQGRKIQSNRRDKADLFLFRSDYYPFLVGLGVILFGYVALSRGPADSFWSLTLAPILLILGYALIIPWAIVRGVRRRPKKGRP